MSLQESIALKLSGKQRVRAKSLNGIFSVDELEFISTFPGASFKEQVLRAQGLGSCAACIGPSQYQGKLNFSKFCSSTCQNNETRTRNDNLRALRLLDLKKDLEAKGLRLENEADYSNVNMSRLNVWCTKCEKSVKAHVLQHILEHKCYVPRSVLPRPVKPPKAKKPKKIKQKVEQRCIDCNAVAKDAASSTSLDASQALFQTFSLQRPRFHRRSIRSPRA